MVDYCNYLTNDNFDSFASKQAWYVEQLSALKSTLSEDKQLQMEVLIDYIQGNIDQLDELKWEIELIKKEDDE